GRGVLPGLEGGGRRGGGGPVPGGGPRGPADAGPDRLRHPHGGLVRTAHAGPGGGGPVTDLASYRDEFPVLERKAYLISASLGPVSRRAQRYLQEYVDA